MASVGGVRVEIAEPGAKFLGDVVGQEVVKSGLLEPKCNGSGQFFAARGRGVHCSMRAEMYSDENVTSCKLYSSMMFDMAFLTMN